MTSKSSSPPSWFWKLLDDARPSLQDLVTALERLPRKKLIAYADAYDVAMLDVCEPWDGPEVDGVQFSEDDTEDFTEWVVSQGRATWERALGAGDLSEIVREYHAKAAKSWRVSVKKKAYRGYQSCRSIATPIFEAVHGGDLAEALEELDD